LLNDIFRGFHTIKGGAGFLNATELVTLCHLTENLFDKLRNGEMHITTEVMDVIMAATGTVRDMFDIPSSRACSRTAADAGLIADLKQAIAGDCPRTSAKVSPALPAATAEAPAVKDHRRRRPRLECLLRSRHRQGAGRPVGREPARAFPQPPKPAEEIIRAAIGRRAADKPGYSGPSGAATPKKCAIIRFALTPRDSTRCSTFPAKSA
jgi:two-component system chemotaxis sensor kinase CheA